MKTLDKEIRIYAPSISLERLLSRHAQTVMRVTFFLATIAGVTFSILNEFLPLHIPAQLLWGATLIFGVLWIDQILTYAYHNSFYFRGLKSVLDHKARPTIVTYDLAEVVLRRPEDVTRAFCESLLGTNVLMRCGILPSQITEFLATERRLISADMVSLPDDKVFSLIGLGKYLLAHDPAFAKLLTAQGLREQTFIDSLRWIIGTHHQQKFNERWWGKDNLSRFKGLGKELSYGTAYILQRFSRRISTSAVFSTLTTDKSFATEKVDEIEQVLAQSKGANVLLIGEPGVGKIDLVMAVEKRVQNGEALDAITGVHMHVLDTNRLFATHQNKAALEQTLIRLFNESLRAGNVVIVIENLSTVIQEAEQLGVFLPELLDEYLSTPKLHIIATDTPSNFHQFLESRSSFTRRFSEILVESTDLSATVRVLEEVALSTEASRNVVFTHESLSAIAHAADRYLVEGVMPEKAINFLVGVASEAEQKEQILVTSDFVYQVISRRTQVPAGPVKDDERELLLNLEDTLHQQVVGQDKALSAVARTMRRARVDIQSSERPIGSFLFLGPTGVGKTETAKALAKVFFGSEDKLERLDMSEFSGGDAIQRLIGTPNDSGVLPDLIQEHPYCVLLLDEFEKANPEVHNLFLQILDEGSLTDGRGNKVNARNTIIIATSNAGATLIMQAVEEKQALSELTGEIVDHIIDEGIFRPELINRFDSTIVFEPLNVNEQGQVANLMLSELYERIKDQGYQLEVGSELIDLLVQKGYSPEFGARPMQRVLQDVLEEKVARKIISGEVKRGDTIKLALADFSEAELNV